MSIAGRWSARAGILSAPVVFVVLAVTIPIAYLLIRAFDADAGQFFDLLFRQRNLTLLVNTLGLAGAVLLGASLVGFSLAWLVERSTFLSPQILTIVGVLPLAVPGYVLAYVLLGISGDYGLSARFLSLQMPPISGFWGSAAALTLYTFPYMFLNLRSGFSGLDPALEESARALGYSRKGALLHVTLPQLKPAFLAGALLVVLHVIGDFGVVSLMRFETLSYAVYLQYTAAFDRTYAACLALILLLLAVGLLIVEFRMLRGLRYEQSWTSPRRREKRTLGTISASAAAVFVVALCLCAVAIPVGTILYWTFSATSAVSSFMEAISGSILASLPTALLAGALAVCVAYSRVRFENRATVFAERAAYLGYATPPLAFALAVIFFSVNIMPALYQSMAILVTALTVHFLAEALGPVRTALHQASMRLEEAARNLGRSSFHAFIEVTFPVIRKSVLAGTVLVFLSVMKELPITLLLSPTGFRTLSVNVWTFTSEAQFGLAAPYALLIVITSGCFAAIALHHHEPIKPNAAR